MTDARYLRLQTVVPAGAARFGRLEGFRRKYKLMKGRQLAEEFPSDVAFYVNRDFPDDLGLEDAAFNLSNQLVVSERLRSFLGELEVPGIEYLPVAMFNHKGVPVKETYAIVNVLAHVDCVDKEATTYQWNALNDTDRPPFFVPAAMTVPTPDLS